MRLGSQPESNPASFSAPYRRSSSLQSRHGSCVPSSASHSLRAAGVSWAVSGARVMGGWPVATKRCERR